MTKPSEPEVSIIIPAYNEEERIVPTLWQTKKYFDDLGIAYEILVVDDGSRDNTSNIVSGLGIAEVKVLFYGENRGKGYAVWYGAEHAAGRWILFSDADNSTPIEEFSKLWPYRDRYEVIIGSRYLADSNITVKQSTPRIIASRLGNLLIQFLILRGIKDTQCGFKLFSREAARRIFAKQTIWRWGFDMEILRIAREYGYKIKEVGVMWRNDDQSRIQSSRVFMKTLAELITVKRNSLLGKYNQKTFFESRRIIKFASVGALGTALDYLTLNVAYLVFEANLYAAVSLGFAVGAVNNYIFNSLWSFRQKLGWKKFGSYFAISLIGLALSNIIVFIFSEQIGWNYNIGKAFAVVIVFGWNYILNRQVTFKVVSS